MFKSPLDIHTHRGMVYTYFLQPN